MNTNLFKEYYEYKLKTMNQYSMILTKIFKIENNKLWRHKRDIEESLYSIIKNYFNRNASDECVNKNFVKCFIDNKDITNFHLENELMSVIEYFINNNEAFEVPAYQKEIILMAVILKIADTIDLATSPFKKNSNNYNTIVINNIEKYNKIDFLELIDDGKKETNLLIELVKTNVRKERKIFELLTSSNSFNRYVSISKDDRYYLAQYNYSVANLNKFDKVAIRMIYEQNGIDDKFVNITADLILITLMKMLSVRKKLKVFFLPVKEIFFDDENNVKYLENIFKDKYIRKHLFLLINYNEFSIDVLKILTKYNCTFYVYCSRNSKITNANRLKDCNNYLASEDFYLINNKIINKWQKEKVNIIKEHFNGMVTDKDFLDE